MTTTNGNRSILDLPRWEMITFSPATKGAGAFVISSRGYKQSQMLVTSVSSHHMYLPHEDAWIQIKSGAFGGGFGAGSCGCSTNIGPTGTATAGTTSTITTNLTLARDIRGYKIHITAGTNAGLTLDIVSNTVGTNSVIKVATQGVAFDNTSQYRILTPRFFVFVGGTGGNSFKHYDFATDNWSAALNVTGPTAAFGTDAELVSTGSRDLGDYISFATGTATSATGTTLVNSGKSWTTNQWANYQVRIISGTGAGQIRSITSNTGTTLTVPTWTITPDSTSVYSIEGNDDYLYLMGNNAVTMYRYSISANTWTTLSPSPARGAAPSTGASAIWVWNVQDADWQSENGCLNGRYIYSFRGGATNTLHRYDIAANGWETMTYAPVQETFTTGSYYCYNKNFIYISKESTGRWFKYALVRNELVPWGTVPYPASTAQLGSASWDVSYIDGSTEIVFIYTLLNNSVVGLRCPVISPNY